MERDIYKLITEYEESEYLKGFKKITVDFKIRCVERFYMFLTERRIKVSFLQVSEKEIEEYKNEIEFETLPDKYNRNMSSLKSFYSFLFENEHVLRNPFLNINYMKTSKENHLGVFTEDEVKRIFSVIPDTIFGKRDSAMLELLYSCALRVGELITLNVDDVDFANSEILIRKGKGDIERIVPVGEESLISLERYFDIRHRFLRLSKDKNVLFMNSSGERVLISTVQRRVHFYKRKAGVFTKGATHAFRHSCATHMLNRGAPFDSVRQLLGHKSLSTSEIYTHLSEEDLKKIHSQSHPRG